MSSLTKKCGCKGVRSCLLCEEGAQGSSPSTVPSLTFTQCRLCSHLLKNSDGNQNGHVTCTPSRISSPVLSCAGDCRFDGVAVVQNFITSDEEREIILAIDQHLWVESQSGRRKQDYGPKVNFKRRRVKLGTFSGLPSFSEMLVEKLKKEVEGLADFTPVELCNLDYEPQRGASIDPHMDDSWLWGERLVTLNLLSDTFLTFTRPTDHTPSSSLSSDVQIEIYMPRCSLVILSGNARHQWQHSIQRGHITSRRVAVTLRELSREFLPGGSSYHLMGKDVLQAAASYTGQPRT